MTSQATELREQIVKLRGNISSDPIHDLRVAMKKLRTIARILGDPSVLEPLRDLYRSCGAVREPEIMAGVLSVLDRDTELKTRRVHRMLNQQSLSAHNDLAEVLGRTPDTSVAACLRAMFSLRTKMADSEISKRMRQALRKSKKKVCRKAHDVDNIKVLHSVRKDLKQMNYLLMIDETMQQARRKRRRSAVSDVEAYIGAIHDRSVLLAWLEDVRSPALSNRDRETLMAMLNMRISQEIRETKLRLRSLCADW